MSSIYMNRELSWLKFNERVLEEAENPEVPLCERLTFASIYQSNLDEFFMVRVGSLYDQTLLDKKIRENKTGMTSQEQIDAILKRTKQINKRKEAVYEELMERVAEQGIRILRFNELDEEGAAYLERYFESEIAPLISPTVVGRRQPFPFLRNLCRSRTWLQGQERPSGNYSMHQQHLRTPDRSSGNAGHLYARRRTDSAFRTGGIQRI